MAPSPSSPLLLSLCPAFPAASPPTLLAPPFLQHPAKFHPLRFKNSAFHRQWHCPCPAVHFLTPPLLVPRSSAEGVPAEILEDPKFVPINDDDPNFGPPAVLLTGFSQDEVSKVQDFVKGFGGFMKVLLCSSEMVKGTLWDAVNSSQPDLTKVKMAVQVPRICFLSGLTGEEIMMFVTTYPKSELEPAVFAALVPRNAQKTVEELMEEIMGDHERLTKGQQT